MRTGASSSRRREPQAGESGAASGPRQIALGFQRSLRLPAAGIDRDLQPPWRPRVNGGPRQSWEIPANADVAQLVEHFTRNEGVPGSSPGVGSRESVEFGGFRSRCAFLVVPVPGYGTDLKACGAEKKAPPPGEQGVEGFECGLDVSVFPTEVMPDRVVHEDDVADFVGHEVPKSGLDLCPRFLRGASPVPERWLHCDEHVVHGA